MRPRSALLLLLIGYSGASSAAPARARGRAATEAAAKRATRPGSPQPASASASKPGALPSFPGAEGFGAGATGGRGGQVCAVTSLAHEGPGTLQACVSRRGPTTVVFRVSGVIAGPVQLTRPDVTIAGQTSPGGVTIRGGLICDNVYEEGSDCRNLILRHLRSRQPESDTLRLGGTQDVMVDHCSFGDAADESIEISRSRRITVQHSIVAEPVGEHFQWGGVLINYSTRAHPLGQITLHHDLWSGVHGRLPEITCEENDDAPGSNCSGHVIEIELASNLLFDGFDPIWFNRCTHNNEGNDCAPSSNDVRLALNWVDNAMARRSSIDEAPMIEPAVAQGGAVYASGNRLCRGDACTATGADVATRSDRHPFPPVTATPASELGTWMRGHVGAFPRDAMDARLVSYLGASVDRRPPSWQGERGIDRGDGLAVARAPAAPRDGDDDGMPDAWESAHGLDPAVAAPNGTTLAGRGDVVGCVAGYTDLECYLNELAEARVAGR